MAPDTNETPPEMDLVDEWVELTRRDFADLLLNGGLYQRVELSPPLPIEEARWNSILPLRLHRDCEVCSHIGQTTWSLHETSPNRIWLHSYRCMSCENASVTFVLAMKPLAVDDDERVGIDDILKMVAESAAAAGDTAAIAQITEASKNLYASDRLKIAAQHTPPHLKPGGHSPLDVMYGAFSEGLHALSDEESAKVANRLLESITYFFEMWQEGKDRAERFAQTITKAATKTS